MRCSNRWKWVLAAALAAAFAACDDGEGAAAGDAGPADAAGGGDAWPPAAWGPAFEPGDAGALLSAWGPAPDDVWTVGGQPDAGVAWHFDGRAWSRAGGVPPGPSLNWVHGVDGEVWLVGDGGRALRGRDGPDGTFEATDTGVDAPLWGVWAAAPDDVWAVGGDAVSTTTPPDPVLLHWDGAAWTRLPLPDVDREFRALFKVWGTGPDHVFAVGSRGVILHFDGQSWTQQGSGTADDLISLWGRGPDEIVAVGGRSNGVVARWDGDGWESRTLVGVPGLNGIWMAPDGTAWAVGLRGTIVRLAPGGFEHARERSGTILVLHGAFGLPGGPRYAVGGSLGERPPYEGVALEFPAP